ncbi:aminotransferase class IV [bacterium]|nr:aminotransferase class IV [bacterium]MBU1433965.1 aminotransferase class IV [bacterium]MBU1502947.1 aminotransferase class IV [bacterium]
MKHKFFETIKALDGQIFHLRYHQERYESVLKSLGMTEFKTLLEYLHPPHKGLYKCRVVYDENSLEVSYSEYVRRDVKKVKLVYDDSIEYAQKAINRENIDALFGLREGCDDVLIVKNSFITDTSIANVAFYKEGIWYTPRTPLLNGTTRARLLEMKKIVEADIREADLKKYTGVALLNAMIEFDIITQENAGEIIC